MAAHEAIGKSDEWYTPEYVFNALGCRFDMDVASPADRTFCSVPADRFITTDSLKQDWTGFVWMNPPFGGRNGLDPWLDKIVQHGNGIALTPDRTSAPWWQKASKRADAVLFVGRKIRFIRPDGTTGDQPGTGTSLFALGNRAVCALQRAQQNGLGILFSPRPLWQ